MNPIKPSLLVALALATVLGCHNKKEDDPQGLIEIEGHVFHPQQVPATDERVAQLKLSTGFSVSKFAENLGKPRMLAAGPAGQVYFTDRDAGTVTLLRDTNADGKADASE